MRKLFYLVLLMVMSCRDRDDAPVRDDNDREILLSGLKRSHEDVLQMVATLSDSQWSWRKDSLSWSVAELVEHLIVHDELFYREVRVLTALPPMPSVSKSEFASDEEVLGYRTITPQNTGNSPTYLEPHGRWCSTKDATSAYRRSRGALVDFVAKLDKNLRAYYTTSGRGPTTYRDLHQLMLISIAHTDRHATQINNIINEPSFPR